LNASIVPDGREPSFGCFADINAETVNLQLKHVAKLIVVHD
jgi:hypothetical protein